MRLERGTALLDPGKGAGARTFRRSWGRNLRFPRSARAAILTPLVK